MRDLTGRKFNRLTVLAFSHEEYGRKYWLCKCDCGVVKPLRDNKLGYTQTCGCSKRTGGTCANRKEYQAYFSMLKRAGTYGYEVCERWKTSYEHFLADMGMAPSPIHVFSRIDKQRSFEPSNCKWATLEEALEFRRTIKYGKEGSTHILSLDSVTKHAPSFFLALPDEVRREVLRLVFTYTHERKGGHSKVPHFPSWQCRECRNEAVAVITWEKLVKMKGENLEHLTIAQALLDLSIVRVLGEQREYIGLPEVELEATLKKRAFEDYLFLNTGRANQEQFEELWASELRERYVRLQTAKQAIRNLPPNTDEQA